MRYYKALHPIKPIAITELLNGERWSPEYFRPDYVENERTLEQRSDVCNLGSLAKRLTCGPFGSSVPSSLFQNSGIPFVRMSNVRPFLLDISNLVFLREHEADRLSAANFKPGDLVLSKTGKTGLATLLPAESKKYVISQDVVGIELKQSFSGYFIVAFLNSRFGEIQFRRIEKGNVQAHLDLTTTRKILVPFPDGRIQDYIGAKVELAERCRAKAFNHLDQAKNLLKNVLGIDPFKIPDLQNLTNDNFKVFSLYPACSSVYPSRLTGMIGAHCYEPIHLAVEKALNQAGVKQKSFADITAEVANGFDCRDFVAIGTPYIKVANLQPGRAVYGSIQYVRVNVDDVPSRQRVRNGDLLITRKGSFGICSGAVREDERAIISSEIIRVRLKNDFDADFIALFLNSVFGRSKFDRLATGTMMQGISHGNLDEIMLPCIILEDQKKVADEVRKWKAFLDVANRLIAEAKGDVESLVEDTLDTEAILAGRLKPPTMEEIIGT